MTELKIKIDDSLINFMGYDEIEKSINDYISQLFLKISANDMLNEFEKIDLENDKDWKIARELAWKQERNSFSKFLDIEK